MDQKEIFNKVVKLISPYAKNKDALDAINDNTKILEDLGVNSARLVDIVLAFEDDFDIEVEDDVADKILTIGDAVKVIDGKIN
ncbi:MAG: phosphopantetheine-binding protein [Spirochaetes bacterium]|nr:phosphopantetheine-binding protein [Spirochaetota bacterium]